MSKRDVVFVLGKAIVIGLLRYVEERNKKKKQPKDDSESKKSVDDLIGLG